MTNHKGFALISTVILLPVILSFIWKVSFIVITYEHLIETKYLCINESLHLQNSILNNFLLIQNASLEEIPSLISKTNDYSENESRLIQKKLEASGLFSVVRMSHPYFELQNTVKANLKLVFQLQLLNPNLSFPPINTQCGINIESEDQPWTKTIVY